MRMSYLAGAMLGLLCVACATPPDSAARVDDALFVLPGIISEVAAVLLLLPFKGPALGSAGTGGTAGSPPFDTPPGPQAGGGSTIDGEYHRVDDDRTQLTERKP